MIAYAGLLAKGTLLQVLTWVNATHRLIRHMAQGRTSKTHKNGSKPRRETPVTDARDIHIKFLVNHEENLMLKDMSAKTGLRVSDLLRQIIRICNNTLAEKAASEPHAKSALLGRTL
jgi:hypothetical protein